MISAVLLSFQRPHYLREALESIANQATPPAEIVLSDCSPPGKELLEIQSAISEFREQHSHLDCQVTFHRRPVEQTAHTHFAFRQCRYPLIAMLHDDDAWLPHHLERSVRRLEAQPSLGLCISNAIAIDSAGQRLAKASPTYADLPESSEPRDWFRYLVRRYFSSFSGYVFRREITDSFPTFATHVVDHHLAMHTAMERLGIAAFREPSLLYRVHTGGTSASITQLHSLQHARYRLYLRLLATRPFRCMTLMPHFPLFVLKGLAHLAAGR